MQAWTFLPRSWVPEGRPRGAHAASSPANALPRPPAWTPPRTRGHRLPQNTPSFLWMRKRRPRAPEVKGGGIGGLLSPARCLPPHGLQRHPDSWGTGPSSPGRSGEGGQVVRSTHEGEWCRELGRGGRRVFRAPASTGARGRRILRPHQGDCPQSQPGWGDTRLLREGPEPGDLSSDRRKSIQVTRGGQGGVAGRPGPATAAPCPSACCPHSASWPRGGMRRPHWGRLLGHPTVCEP